MFHQIPSERKFYNKILDRNTQAFESDELLREGQREYFQQASGALNRKFNTQDDTAEREALQGEAGTPGDLMMMQRPSDRHSSSEEELQDE